MEHILLACSILAKEQYIKTHDRVCAQQHFNICKEIGIKLDKEQWCDHIPKSVTTSHEGKVPYYGTNKCEQTELFLT